MNLNAHFLADILYSSKICEQLSIKKMQRSVWPIKDIKIYTSSSEKYIALYVMKA